MSDNRNTRRLKNCWVSRFPPRVGADTRWNGIDRAMWNAENLAALAQSLRGSESDEPSHSIVEHIMQHARDCLCDDRTNAILAAQLKREIDKLDDRYRTHALRSLDGADEYPMHGSLESFEDNHTIGVLDSEELQDLIDLLEEAALKIAGMTIVQSPSTTKGST